MSSEYYQWMRRENLREGCDHEFEPDVKFVGMREQQCKHCGVNVSTEIRNWYETGRRHGQKNEVSPGELAK